MNIQKVPNLKIQLQHLLPDLFLTALFQKTLYFGHHIHQTEHQMGDTGI